MNNVISFLNKRFGAKLRFAPRWTIFLLDIACVLMALTVSFLLRFNFDLIAINEYPLMFLTVFSILINAGFLYGFKAYKGIVRYTTFEDSGRLLVVNILVCSIFVVLELFHNSVTSLVPSVIPVSVIIIYFFCVNFFQLLYRLAVKRIFNYLFTSKRKTEKAVIFNARHEGMMAKIMISENQKSSLKIVAFLDDSPKFFNKKLENIPVIKLSKYALRRLKSEGVNLLIIADPFIRQDVLNDIVDSCLEYDIRVQQIPSSEKWINNELDEAQLKDIKIEQLLDREEINPNNASLSSALKGKKILITGAAGSIGSEIVRQVLKHQPAIVIAADIAETPLHILQLEIGNRDDIVYFIGDICDRIRMEQVFEIYEPDLIYHAAAYKHVPLMENNPSTAVRNNVMGTKNLAELSVAYGAEKFVMVSTDKAVNPTNVMGASKRIAEIFTQSYYNHLQNQIADGKIRSCTKFITTRFGNVLGSNGSVIPRFSNQIKEGGPITVTHPDITRYFMTIPEACRLVLEAGLMGNGGEIFVFDMGSPVKIVDLAKKMIRLSGLMPDRDIKIEFSGLRPGEKLYEELLNNSENTMPTHHHKILIAHVREYDFAAISNDINDLLAMAINHINLNTVSKMKKIVPEFISKNSIYEQLDKQR